MLRKIYNNIQNKIPIYLIFSVSNVLSLINNLPLITPKFNRSTMIKNVNLGITNDHLSAN